MSLTKVSYSMITGAPANVLDFGAVGNGVTDDSVAIQAALDSGASELIFPSICLITAKLEINASIKIIGPGGLKRNTVGPGSPSSVGAGAVFEINADNVEINGLQFIGSQAGSTIATVNYADACIWVPGVDSTDPLYNIKILNCHIDGFAGLAIDIRYTENVWVENNTILNCGYAGVTYESVINGSISNNIIDNITAGSGAVNFYGISLSRNPNGTLITDKPTTNVVVTGNQVSNVPKWTGLDSHAAYKCQYVNNIVTGCANGIVIQYDDTSGTSPSPAKDILVDGNIVYGNTTLNTNRCGIVSLGIYPSNPNENITISNNIVVGCGTWGGVGQPTAGAIGLLDTKFGVVKNNTIEKAIRYGMGIINACEDCIIEGNTINGVIAGAAAAFYFITVLTDLQRIKIANNNFINETGDSNYNPGFGIGYQGAPNTTVIFSQNRMPTLPSAKLRRGEDGVTNVYTDLSWELEFETIVFNYTTTGGAATESVGNKSGSFRRLPNTSGTFIFNSFIQQSPASGSSAFPIGINGYGATVYTPFIYKFDGTNIGAGIALQNINFTVQGIFWDD